MVLRVDLSVSNLASVSSNCDVSLPTFFWRCSFSKVTLGRVSSESSKESTDASNKGYGSGASDKEEYTCRNAELVDFEWFVIRSINVWYARTRHEFQNRHVH